VDYALFYGTRPAEHSGMNSPFPSPESIFGDAIQLESATDRAAFLRQTCGDDRRLHGQMEKLVADHFRAGRFLDAPAAVATIDMPAPTELAGTQIGLYKLREQIGEGGFGVVYVAEQEKPVARKVALKIIKPGMDTRDVIARFEAERQALALMDHPNIAKVLDAGTTGGNPKSESRNPKETQKRKSESQRADDNDVSDIRNSNLEFPSDFEFRDSNFRSEGRPYFVMELVRGVPITEFCDERKLSTGERLRLFVDVCRAVQHAHQKGIIHRDLKPSNVMVTLRDDKPIPKVIDFGVSKALSSKLTEKTIYTAYGQMIGTPLYMSPEQAQLNEIDVDTRSDVYSLGVLLYELLTGTTPFDKETLKTAGFDEMRRIIREVDPPRPSARISTLRGELLSTVSGKRKIDPRKLSQSLRGELDWIVMKALEKDRNRRYETASAFAADLERNLADEPVQARPTSVRYRLRKFARRNKGTLLAAGLVVAALVGGIIGTTVGLMRAERALQREAAERRIAKDSANIAKQREAETQAVLDFVEKKVFAAARPRNQDGGLGYDVKLADAVKAALPFVDKSFEDEPLVEARLRKTLGMSFYYLGEFEAAAEQFQKARSIFTRYLGPDHRNTLSSMDMLATCYNTSVLGRYADALELRKESLALKKAKLGPDHRDTLWSMNNVALSYTTLGRHAEAVKLNEKILSLRKSTLGPDHYDTLASMNNLALSYYNLGRHTDALKLRERTLSLIKAKLGSDHPDTLNAMRNLAMSYDSLGRLVDACKLYEETLMVQKSKLGPDHPDTLASMTSLAASYYCLGRLAEALNLSEETLALKKAKFGSDHSATLMSMSNLAAIYARLGRHVEAVKLYEKVLALRKAKLALDDPLTLMAMSDLAGGYTALRRYADALKLHEELLPLQRAKLGPDHPDTLVTMREVAADYGRLGRLADACKLNEKTLTLMNAKLGPDHVHTFMCMRNQAVILLRLHRSAQAVSFIDAYLKRAARRVVNPRSVALLLDLRILRLRICEEAADVIGCRATAKMWEDLKRSDAKSLYVAACMRAVTAALIKHDAKTPRTDAIRLARQEADRAMAWLKQAVDAGYRDATHMARDKDFDALRGRADFRKLLAEVKRRQRKPGTRKRQSDKGRSESGSSGR
jgi:eukaryotic-like serine/threonine-protein kinase